MESRRIRPARAGDGPKIAQEGTPAPGRAFGPTRRRMHRAGEATALKRSGWRGAMTGSELRGTVRASSGQACSRAASSPSRVLPAMKKRKSGARERSKRVASASWTARTSNLRLPGRTVTRSGTQPRSRRRTASVSVCARTRLRRLVVSTPKTAQHAIAGPGAVGDAGIDDGDGNGTTMASAKQVGPELGFGEDEQAGLNRVEIGPNGPGAHRAGNRKHDWRRSAGTPKPGRCGWWWKRKSEIEGRLCPKLGDEAADGQYFTHRDGMQQSEGRSAAGCAARAERDLQATGEVFAVFMGGRHPPQPPWCTGNETGEQCHVIEKQNHV